MRETHVLVGKALNHGHRTFQASVVSTGSAVNPVFHRVPAQKFQRLVHFLVFRLRQPEVVGRELPPEIDAGKRFQLPHTSGMLDLPAEPPTEAVRVRTTVFGHDLAVIGQGHLPAGGDVQADGRHEAPNVYRRLVYRNDRLVGALVLGTGETVAELNALVAEQADRGRVEAILAPAADAGGDRVPTTFARHCPICAAELVVHGGTRAGAHLRCQACNTDLVVRWDGRGGWVEIAKP